MVHGVVLYYFPTIACKSTIILNLMKKMTYYLLCQIDLCPKVFHIIIIILFYFC